MSKAKLFGAMAVTFMATPIWLYLLYKILEAVNASELMWFLYWVYLPVAMLSTFFVKAMTDD